MLKWEDDLIEDIRFGDVRDDVDDPILLGWKVPFCGLEVEFTECNKVSLLNEISKIKSKWKSILEIGVYRNGENSSTHCFLKEKGDDVFYFGVDIEDKSFLDNKSRNIFTVKENSSNFGTVVNFIKSKGVEKLDFIFIDGWHSINQVLDDWEYTRLLSNFGVVGFHDITSHPGPQKFVNNLRPDLWIFSGNKCIRDYGIGFVERRV